MKSAVCLYRTLMSRHVRKYKSSLYSHSSLSLSETQPREGSMRMIGISGVDEAFMVRSQRSEVRDQFSEIRSQISNAKCLKHLTSDLRLLTSGIGSIRITDISCASVPFTIHR